MSKKHNNDTPHEAAFRLVLILLLISTTDTEAEQAIAMGNFIVNDLTKDQILRIKTEVNRMPKRDYVKVKQQCENTLKGYIFASQVQQRGEA